MWTYTVRAWMIDGAILDILTIADRRAAEDHKLRIETHASFLGYKRLRVKRRWVIGKLELTAIPDRPQKP